MRILFVLRRPSLVRYLESTIATLAERGHELDLVFSELIGKGDAPPDLDRALAVIRRFPGRITYTAAPEIDPSGGWRGIASAVRIWGDFARFVHPRFANAPLLRRRIAHRAKLVIRPSRVGARTSRMIFALVDLLERTQSRSLAAAAAWLGRRLEEAIPAAPEVVAHLRRTQPDVVLVSPLIDAGSDQVEYVKAARALGVPSGACIASWDNLSSKGVIRLDPDRVFVWNEVQMREAQDMHGIPPAQVVVTGAPRFDPWFERGPSRNAAELARVSGIDTDRPYFLYLCSSAFIAPNELPFVRRWLDVIRSDMELARFGVIVRPHPQNPHVWIDADLSAYENVAVWPRAGANVDDEKSSNDFYDSISHSAAVVGINTSALIEAAILGKNVFTVVDDSFASTQTGTLHFHYLLHDNGGFLREANSLADHVVQLRTGVRDAPADLEQTRRFVESFVRPRGLSIQATHVLADEIEALAQVRAQPLPRSLAAHVLRAGLSALAYVRRLRMGRRRPASVDRRVAELEEQLRAEAPSRRIEAERRESR